MSGALQDLSSRERLTVPSYARAPFGSLQRKCACGGNAGVDGECAECRKKRLQRRANSAATPDAVPPILHEVLRTPGQPLDARSRAFMEPRLGHNFSNVRVHTDSRAAESARAVNARAYAVGRDVVFDANQYAPHSNEGRKLLAHELTHVVQQKNNSMTGSAALELGAPADGFERQANTMADQIVKPQFGALNAFAELSTPRVQRDLALEPTVVSDEEPELTADQIRRAINYNRASYEAESTRQIQDLVGAEQTGTFDEATVRAVARIQRDFNLKADGKVGPDTYDLLIRELQAEGGPADSCLTMFQIDGPETLTLFPHAGNPNLGTIGSRWFMRARFDPRCNCEDFEYRQYIAGNVEHHTAAGVVTNLNHLFVVPGGLAPGALKEDGDTTIPAGTAGHNYGHRSAPPSPGPSHDRYLPNRRTGCEYSGRDLPELGPIPIGPANSGDRYEWLMRFRGVITRRGHGVVAEKYWAIRGPIVVP